METIHSFPLSLSHDFLTVAYLAACAVNVTHRSDTMDSVKQSAALCLLRLYKTSPDLVLMGEWTSRVVHLLNDQHMVSTRTSMRSHDAVSLCVSN